MNNTVTNGHPSRGPRGTHTESKENIRRSHTRTTYRLCMDSKIDSYVLQLLGHIMIKRTGIVDLRFHDLRHEAISRFFEMGLSVPEVALISGHRDYRMLQRYTHLKPEQVALKLQ